MARLFYILLVATLAASASSQSLTTPMCGSQANGVGCADASHCCSPFGFCGVGIDTTSNKGDFCGAGCQGGPCKSGNIALKPAATTKPNAATSANFGTVLVPGLAMLAGSVGTGLLGGF